MTGSGWSLDVDLEMAVLNEGVAAVQAVDLLMAVCYGALSCWLVVVERGNIRLPTVENGG